MDKGTSMRISGSYPWGETTIEPDLRVLSLGAGVQSTRILLGILEGEYGEIGKDAPSCAIFSDTQWEPKPVYEHLEWLIDKADEADFPIHIVTAGNIRNDVLRTSGSRKSGKEGRFAAMPLHTLNTDGEAMMMRRQCTREYKIEPIEKKIRELLGLKPRQRCKSVVESWQGISYDEMQRMRENQSKHIWNRYPLIEKRETRQKCLLWLDERGYTSPKSACIGCPFHDNAYWRWLRETSPDDWQDAVEFDRTANQGDILGWDRPAFLHRSLVPLDQVDLTDPNQDQTDLFLSECEGICGV